MTLIVTAVSRAGVVMVGDSAETCTLEGGSQYIRTGARKVLPVKALNAGISMWGPAAVGVLPMDIWVERFVANEVSPTWSLGNMAQELANALNREGIFPGEEGKNVGGLHVAGYEQIEGRPLPSVYHVHNKHPHEEAHELRVNHDFPDREYSGHTERYPTDLDAGRVEWHLRNGEYQTFIAVWDALVGDQRTPPDQRKSVLASFQKQGVTCPAPDTLPSRARFYSFLVEIVARLFSMYSTLETIAMPLSVLTLDEKGIQDYQPAVQRAATTTVTHAE